MLNYKNILIDDDNIINEKINIGWRRDDVSVSYALVQGKMYDFNAEDFISDRLQLDFLHPKPVVTPYVRDNCLYESGIPSMQGKGFTLLVYRNRNLVIPIVSYDTIKTAKVGVISHRSNTNPVYSHRMLSEITYHPVLVKKVEDALKVFNTETGKRLSISQINDLVSLKADENSYNMIKYLRYTRTFEKMLELSEGKTLSNINASTFVLHKNSTTAKTSLWRKAAPFEKEFFKSAAFSEDMLGAASHMRYYIPSENIHRTQSECQYFVGMKAYRTDSEKYFTEIVLASAVLDLEYAMAITRLRLSVIEIYNLSKKLKNLKKCMTEATFGQYGAVDVKDIMKGRAKKSQTSLDEIIDSTASLMFESSRNSVAISYNNRYISGQDKFAFNNRDVQDYITSEFTESISELNIKSITKISLEKYKIVLNNLIVPTTIVASGTGTIILTADEIEAMKEIQNVFTDTFVYCAANRSISMHPPVRIHPNISSGGNVCSGNMTAFSDKVDAMSCFNFTTGYALPTYTGFRRLLRQHTVGNQLLRERLKRIIK